VPRLSGDIVTLEILTSADRIDDSGRMAVQRLQTAVTGRLGEWILIGGIDKTETATARGVASSDQAAASERRSVRVKVEEVR
jgi:hypothetical protein